MTARTMAPVLHAGAFFVVISLTIGLTRLTGQFAMVWLGTAIGAGWLITLPRTKWPLAMATLALLSAIATSLFGFGPRLAVPLAVANVFEVWLVARLMLLARPERDWLDSIPGLAALILVGGLIAPLLAGMVSALAVSTIVGGAFAKLVLTWWAAHGLGAIIGFPLAQFARSLFRKHARDSSGTGAPLELLGHCAAIFVTAVIAMEQARLPLLFLPIVPVLIAAFRCGRAGAVLGTIIVGAVSGHAVFAGRSIVNTLDLSVAEQVFFLQFYLAAITLQAIPLSVGLRQHRNLLRELDYRKALQRLIVEHCDDVLVNLDEAGTIRFASPAGERFAGCSDLEGKPFAVFFDPLDAELVEAALETARTAKAETVVIERAVLRGDEEIWLEARLRTAAVKLPTSMLEGFAVTIREITERKNLEIEAVHASETDPLTQLPNRRVLLQELGHAIAQAGERPAALAIVDLDHFKAVNDVHGHLVGDTVLREVANVMRRYAGPERTFGRLGGEEFALVDTSGSFTDSVALCEDLRGAIAAILPQGGDGRRFMTTASIGLTRIVKGQGVPEVLHAADQLLYKAKSAGRNRVEAHGRTRRALRAAA